MEPTPTTTTRTPFHWPNSGRNTAYMDSLYILTTILYNYMMWQINFNEIVSIF